MVGRIAALVTALIVGAALLASGLGLLQPVDNQLRDWRAQLVPRDPSGTVVFVDIDSATLAEVGVWPWPRRVHARIINRLMQLGAADVVVDIDFSTVSNANDDALLQAALQDAGGYAMLAAFRQVSGDVRSPYNLPLERFRRYADPVVVNLGTDPRGTVRSYPYGSILGGREYRSAASVLSGRSGPAETAFLLDFSIRADGIPRVSAAALLAGTVDAALIEGRHVIVGSGAVELRDLFVVPSLGVLPGGLVHGIATETLLQNRQLIPLGPLPSMLVVAASALLSLFLRRRISMGGTIAGAAGGGLVVEAVALVLQSQQALLFDTAAIQLALAGLALQAILHELAVKKMLQLKATQERDVMRSILDRVIADNFDGVIVIGDDGKILAASRLAEDVLGAGLTGSIARKVLPRELSAAVAAVIGGKDEGAAGRPAEMALPATGGRVPLIEYSITLSEIANLGEARDGRSGRVACLTFRDITERRRNDERLSWLATHDAMTGAWSRLRLLAMIEGIMADDATRADGVSVVVINLGRFSAVNDTLGHSYGDMVLKQVAGRLRACGFEAVARVGGDSFALARPGALAADELERLCVGLIEAVTRVYILDNDHQAIVAASAGATTSHASGYDAEVLLSHADMALSAAKRVPGSHHAIFTPEMDERLKENQDMEAALRDALREEQLTLSYQAQVDLETGEMVGVEALVRWVHPQLGAVSPLRFVTVAEETGQIVELGRFVLRTACADAATWPASIRLAVNVSPIQFELVDVADEVEQALAQSGLAPGRLDIEITEGLFMSRADSITTMLERLRAMGVGIALDDFGTGYSSLSYLGRLPVDKIKIDQSFVRKLPADQESGAIVRAVMTLCETLNKVVVAEGIENADQAWMLRILGCTIGQGYHYGRPRTASEMAAVLARGPGALAAQGADA